MQETQDQASRRPSTLRRPRQNPHQPKSDQNAGKRKGKRQPGTSVLPIPLRACKRTEVLRPSNRLWPAHHLLQKIAAMRQYVLLSSALSFANPSGRADCGAYVFKPHSWLCGIGEAAYLTTHSKTVTVLPPGNVHFQAIFWHFSCTC